MTACMAAWAAEPYVVYTPSNTTLTFYYGTKPSGAYSLNSAYYRPEWYHDGTYASVTRVIFDSSFAQARPTATSYWFSHMENLESMLGLNYLNTSQVTDMMYMFSECKKLTNLNLSGFNTSNVNRMVQMFYGCKSLAILNVSSFNTSNVIDMSNMFGQCENLTSLDLSSFNTSKTTSMQGMFRYCKSLSNLEISSFNTSKVVNMRAMFSYCENLTTISVSDNWSTQATSAGNSVEMFLGCTKLVGGAGTTYDPNHVNMAYAHIDGGPSNPGYFTGGSEEFDLWINGVRVTGANKNGVTGPGISGSVTYEPSTNTLTLNNATIDQRGLAVVAISTAYGSPANFKIKLVGTNKILANSNSIALKPRESQGFTIYGSGTLNCGGALFLDARDHLTNDATVSYIKDCSVYFENILTEDYEECLTIDNADVTTEYLYVGADHNGYEGLKLINCYVAQPQGGYVYDGNIYVGNSTDWWYGHVEIKRSAIYGDVDNDRVVTSQDITLLYNLLLTGNSSGIVNGDVDNDGYITSADITEIYSILLGVE